MFVGLGRAVVAANLAAVVLVVHRAPWPGWASLPRLALVAGGVVVGFPHFSARLLGERIDTATILAAALVIAAIAVGRRGR